VLEDTNAEIRKENRTISRKYETARMLLERNNVYNASKDKLLATVMAEKERQDKYFNLLLEYTQEILLLLDKNLRFVYCSRVFLGHMMPGMDGIETTAAIRALEGDYFKKLPVIALTASAISGMREMFLENGFNDYLSKPIELSRLNEVMEKWIPKSKQRKKPLNAQSEAL
jgi:CheY-like chemotaxis protein